MNEELPFSNEQLITMVFTVCDQPPKKKITIVSIDTSDEMLGVHFISGGALIELRISFGFAYFDVWI